MEEPREGRPASVQAALSQVLRATSTRTTLNCVECGQEFTTYVWVLSSGRQLSLDKCPVCTSKDRERRKVTDAQEELAKLDNQTRLFWRSTCGVEPKFVDKTFANFEVERQPRAFSVLNSWDGQSVILHSPGGPTGYGIGKTHLVSALANWLITHSTAAYFCPGSLHIEVNRCPVLVIRATELINRIRATFGRDKDDARIETDEHIYRQLAAAPLLIIDDVGKVRPRDPSFTQDVFFRIIDDRYNKKRPVILTTNLSLEELDIHIGGASSDRLSEMCRPDNIIFMAGQSYRKF